MREKTSLGVIVPCYNEADNIEHFDKELSIFTNFIACNHPHYDVKFYVVDNNSNDGTSEKLLAIANKHPQMSILSCSRQGYGAALKHGFSIATGHHFLGFLDFDNTYPMESFVALLDCAKSKNLDIVYGARLHQKSRIELVRKAGNFFYVVLMRFFLKSPLSDVCSGMRVFRSHKVSEVLGLSANDLSFSIQFTGHTIVNKWKLDEVPINYRCRVGESKLSVFADGFKFLFILLKTTLVRK